MTDSLPMRTDHCGTLRASDIGRRVSVCGWVARRREHGEHLAFIDLRDHTGLIQCVVDGAHDLRSEYVVRITVESVWDMGPGPHAGEELK